MPANLPNRLVASMSPGTPDETVIEATITPEVRRVASCSKSAESRCPTSRDTGQAGMRTSKTCALISSSTSPPGGPRDGPSSRLSIRIWRSDRLPLMPSPGGSQPFGRSRRRVVSCWRASSAGSTRRGRSHQRGHRPPRATGQPVHRSRCRSTCSEPHQFPALSHGAICHPPELRESPGHDRRRGPPRQASIKRRLDDRPSWGVI